MKREELIRLLANVEVVKAWVDGKTVQVRVKDAQTPEYTVWRDYRPDEYHPTISPDFINENWQWRVKPTPREFWLAFVDGYQTVFKVKPDRTLPNTELVHVREVTP